MALVAGTPVSVVVGTSPTLIYAMTSVNPAADVQVAAPAPGPVYLDDRPTVAAGLGYRLTPGAVARVDHTGTAGLPASAVPRRDYSTAPASLWAVASRPTPVTVTPYTVA